jgi:hypothetical protein
MQQKKKLPIGIQTFEKIIEGNCYYVDKTRYIQTLASRGDYYFLSRPRRFGKSLLLSTIEAAFQGKKALFSGLYLENNWDWEQTRPVIHISFGSGVVRSIAELQVHFSEMLDDLRREHSIACRKTSLNGQFTELISALSAKYRQKVVVLVDEYDKPILDNIEKTALAAQIRDELKNYYSVIKDSDRHIEFVFITGVSKFSKVSLFSGLNNLQDITLNKEYSALCGYTQSELETLFADRLAGRDLAQIKEWYNGYNWLGDAVYNPFDILLYLDSGDFSNYWFETGTPAFLIKLLQQGRYFIPGLEKIFTSEKMLGSFDVETIEVEPLLFQTGYLTIASVQQMSGIRRFCLTYPNQEVKQALTDSLLTFLCGNMMESEQTKFSVYDALLANDLDQLKDIFHRFFASIPHDWYRKNQLAGYEGYYASIVYCYFASLGLDVTPEVSTNKGRIDLVLRFAGRVYIIEFKVTELTGSGKALEQILEKGYAEQFVSLGPDGTACPVYLIGVAFSSEEKNIAGFEWRELGGKNG